MDRTRKPPKLRPALGKLIRENLLRVRESKGFTLDELATRAGLTPVGVRKIANGDNNPSLSTLDALSRALDVPLSELISPRK